MTGFEYLDILQVPTRKAECKGARESAMRAVQGLVNCGELKSALEAIELH